MYNGSNCLPVLNTANKKKYITIFMVLNNNSKTVKFQIQCLINTCNTDINNKIIAISIKLSFQ